jgi:hypothetical protein
MRQIDEQLGVFVGAADVARDLDDDRVGHPGIVPVVLNDKRWTNARSGIRRGEIHDHDTSPTNAALTHHR